MNNKEETDRIESAARNMTELANRLLREIDHDSVATISLVERLSGERFNLGASIDLREAIADFIARAVITAFADVLRGTIQHYVHTDLGGRFYIRFDKYVPAPSESERRGTLLQ